MRTKMPGTQFPGYGTLPKNVLFLPVYFWFSNNVVKKCKNKNHILLNNVPDPWHFVVDLDPRIHASDSWIRILDPDPAIFVIDLQDASKKLIFYTIFSDCYFLKVHIQYFSKIKSQKESQNSRIQGFSYYFCMI